MDEISHSGFAALVGRPNAGKSTLVNALVGTKVAIVSDKAQTTRHRLRAVVDMEDAQLVLIDTPGLHKPIDALGEELNRSALMALADVDVVCMLVDASKVVGRGDQWVAAHVAASPAAKVLVMTKADLVDQLEMERRTAEGLELAPFDAVVNVSAADGFNLDGFTAAVTEFLPPGPRYFPRDMATDQTIEVMIAELIREKVLLNTFDEVPHAVGVALEDLEYKPQTDTSVIYAVVYVERDSQKGIVVGKGGAMIKRVGEEARADLERLLGNKVWLDLNVKVKKDWRRDAAQIRRFGYGEGR
jgi:GTP-binding protein Era